MVSNLRKKMPYRKNCEAYIIHKGKILARDSGKGYIEFPGGGFDKHESAKDAVTREIFEETGAMIGDLRKIGLLHFDWGPRWAKTEKQKMRYKQFRGEEMHLFKGKVKKLTKPKGCPVTKEPGWKGKRFMAINDALKIINAQRPFPRSQKKYYGTQIDVLSSFQQG